MLKDSGHHDVQALLTPKTIIGDTYRQVYVTWKCTSTNKRSSSTKISSALLWKNSVTNQQHYMANIHINKECKYIQTKTVFGFLSARYWHAKFKPNIQRLIKTLGFKKKLNTHTMKFFISYWQNRTYKCCFVLLSIYFKLQTCLR